MCGIAGFVGSGDRDDLAAMTRRLAHRGPDGESFHIDAAEAVYLGHRRLAVIDPAGGEQPQWNEDHTICVICNGEIYNHRELRSALIRLGHRFRTDHSDTEVLVHGYEEWGEQLPLRLNGMFALAIFDRNRRQLFLARDRFGEKPLFVMQAPGLLAFASEAQALAGHRRLGLQFDGKALQKYCALGYVPAPHSLWRDCWKLEPGSSLRIGLADGSLQKHRYWRFRLNPDEALAGRGEGQLQEELRALLRQSVERRLIADVPLGVFLSGGVDSTAALSLAVDLSPARRLKAFTLGFGEPSYDESAFAREAAAAIGCDHRVARFPDGEIWGLAAEILGRMDEPIADPSILPTSMLAKFARGHVTVALSGDGGDELFAGYDPFLALAPAEAYVRLMPPAADRLIRALAERLPRSARYMSLDFKLRRALLGLQSPPSLWNAVWMGPLAPSDFAAAFETPLPIEEVFEDVLELWECGRRDGLGLVDQSLQFFSRFYLSDNILAKADRASMMHSLEVRSIFLDNDLVDFCSRLPSRFKLRGRRRKHLLREALRGVVPEAVLARRKKGFGMPADRWLRADSAPSLALQGTGLREDWIAARAQEHRAGTRDHRLLLWAATALSASGRAWQAAPGVPRGDVTLP